MSDLAGDMALLKSLEADPVDKRGLFASPVWLDGLRRHIREYHGVDNIPAQTTSWFAVCPWKPDGPPHPHSAEGYCVEMTP